MYAATLLLEFGIDYQNYVELSAHRWWRGMRRNHACFGIVAWADLSRCRIWSSETVRNLRSFSHFYANQRLKRKPWSRKEAFGHLVDWAVTHQQWFARALTEPRLEVESYPMDEWCMPAYRLASSRSSWICG